MTETKDKPQPEPLPELTEEDLVAIDMAMHRDKLVQGPQRRHQARAFALQLKYDREF